MASFRNLRILVITREDLVPPCEGVPLGSKDPIWKTDFDVIDTLKGLRHTVEVLGVGSEVAPLETKIREFKPDLVWNLLDDFAGHGVLDQNIVSYLELLGCPYTGCNPKGLLLARDKALSKKILAYHKFLVPKFLVYKKGEPVAFVPDSEFPLIVKSLTEQGSRGISQASLVTNQKQLERRAEFVHGYLQTDAIAEQFIEGREFYVGVMGNSRCSVLPVWEIDFGKDSGLKIATEQVKWNEDYQLRHGIKFQLAKGLSQKLEKRLQEIAKRAFRVLGLSGFARFDFRMNADCEIYLLEANPNPDIGREQEFADSAKAHGIEYANLLGRIISLGLKWRPLEQ